MENFEKNFWGKINTLKEEKLDVSKKELLENLRNDENRKIWRFWKEWENSKVNKEQCILSDEDLKNIKNFFDEEFKSINKKLDSIDSIRKEINDIKKIINDNKRQIENQSYQINMISSLIGPHSFLDLIDPKFSPRIDIDLDLRDGRGEWVNPAYRA